MGDEYYKMRKIIAKEIEVMYNEGKNIDYITTIIQSKHKVGKLYVERLLSNFENQKKIEAEEDQTQKKGLADKIRSRLVEEAEKTPEEIEKIVQGSVYGVYE